MTDLPRRSRRVGGTVILLSLLLRLYALGVVDRALAFLLEPNTFALLTYLETGRYVRFFSSPEQRPAHEAESPGPWLPPEPLAPEPLEMALPYIKEVITKDYDLKKIAEMVKTRIEVFPDIKDLIDFFEELPEYDINMYTHKKMKTSTESSLEVLKEVLPILKEQDDYSNDALYQTLVDFVAKKECKNGYVMWPIRTAVSGKQMTPAGATEIMEVIGKEESIKRIEKGIALLEAALS